MKRRFHLAAVLLLLTGACGLARAEDSLPELWFPVGEKLVYDMHYGVMHVGTTTVTSEWINEQGKPRLVIRFVTRTNKFFDKVYRVNDTVEAIIDPATFRPVRFSKKLEEGDFTSNEVTDFDYEKKIAVWKSRTTGKTCEFKISDDTRDIVSFMYAMRRTPLEAGKLGDYWVAGDQGVCRLRLRGGRMREISLPRFGEIQAARVVPEAGKDDLFVRKMPRELWVSADDRRLIVKMAVKVPVAHVVLTLKNVSGPGDDIWTRKSVPDVEPVLARED
jgi:hypothetical protein